MAPRVLVSDELSETAVQIFRDRGVEVDFQPKLGKDKDKLAEIIGNYDGLAIRSATKVTEKLINAATNLKVVGRAGIGVDNVDIPAASRRGIIVMNTPFGNSITTAEHAIALMFAVARQLPAADGSTQAGKWEKSRFMGVEITGKTLGVIGAGNIGSIVCARALGLKMHVLAYDPFLSAERAQEMGVTKVELDELLSRSDFITLHVPLTDKTRNILDKEAIAKTKQGVRIINCARGGLVDEAALAEAIKSGHVAGAGFDDKAIKRQIAIISSMTKAERANPDILKHSRKKRIAAGSGTDAAEINKLLKMHRGMADMMKAMGGGKGGGMMKQMMGGLANKMGLGGLGMGGGMPDLSSMDPKQLEALAKQAEAAGIKPGSLPGLGGGGLPGLGGPKLPGLGGGFPGLPGLSKKK